MTSSLPGERYFANTRQLAPRPTFTPLARKVSLADVLANRDARASRLSAALKRFRHPVVAMTLVLPGPHKDTPASRILLEEALRAAEERFREHSWTVILREAQFMPTGPEAIRVVAADPLELKRVLVELEDTHPLGRLWDLDVHCPVRGGLSRKSLGLPPRRCLICAQPAHGCARSQAHPLPELLAAIEGKLHAFAPR